MEGFASSIRGSIRTIREACYSILWCMSKLDVDFYGFNELPGPLAHALFADADCLSTHQLIALLNVVRLLVDDCPVELRGHFVPPILATCFAQIDAKCSSEWEKLAHKQVAAADGDNLTDEMKAESILRQLTHAAVMIAAGVLDPARQSEKLHAHPRALLTVSRCRSKHYNGQRCFNIQSGGCSIVISIYENILSHLLHHYRTSPDVHDPCNPHA